MGIGGLRVCPSVMFPCCMNTTPVRVDILANASGESATRPGVGVHDPRPGPILASAGRALRGIRRGLARPARPPVARVFSSSVRPLTRSHALRLIARPAPPITTIAHQPSRVFCRA